MDDDEADSAHNDEQPHRADDDRVAHVAGQRYIRFRPPEDVEPGVAEGGDGGKHRDEDALRPELGHEHGRQQERAAVSTVSAVIMTTFMSWLMSGPVDATDSCARCIPRRPELAAIAMLKKVVSVTSPRPPIWMSARMTHCPKADQ